MSTAALSNAQMLQSPRISHEKLWRHFNQNKMPLWKLEGAQLRHMQGQRLSGTVVRLTDERSARSARSVNNLWATQMLPLQMERTLSAVMYPSTYTFTIISFFGVTFELNSSGSEGLWPPTPRCYKFPGLRCEIRLLSDARGHAWCQSGRDTSEDIIFLFLLTKTMVRLETRGQKLNCKSMSMWTALFEKLYYIRTSVFSPNKITKEFHSESNMLKALNRESERYWIPFSLLLGILIELASFFPTLVKRYFIEYD